MADVNLLTRIRAGRLAEIKGLEIKEEIGEELAIFIKNGGNRLMALEVFDIRERFDLTDSVALSALRKAIAGSKGRYGISYEGIIPREELEELNRKAMSVRGNMTLYHKMGIYGLSPMAMREIHSKAGKAVRDKKKGIHGLTEEENTKNRRLAILARGRTPWEEMEKTRVYICSNDPEYKIGPHYNLGKIAELINDKYHNGRQIRTSVSIGQILTQHKKRMKNPDKVYN